MWQAMPEGRIGRGRREEEASHGKIRSQGERSPSGGDGSRRRPLERRGENNGRSEGGGHRGEEFDGE